MKRKHGFLFSFAVLLIATMFTVAGCGDSDSGNPTGTGDPKLIGTITISPGGPVTVGTLLTANYSGTETVTYQWKRGSTNVGTSNTYTPDQPGSYTVTVSAAGYQSKTSAAVTVTDDGIPQLSGSVTIIPNSDVTTGTQLTANYSGTETITYQWKRSSTNVGTSNTYTPDQAGSYTVTVSAAGYQSKTSAAVNVSGSPVISITTQPANLIVREGNISDRLTVAATVPADAMPAYQWYSNTNNSNIGGTEISDAIYETFYIPTNLTEGTYYYFCEVTATGVASVRSDVATVTVNPVPQGDVDRISLIGFPLDHNDRYITIDLYSNANVASLSGSDPRYSGRVAQAEGIFSGGSASNCLLFDPTVLAPKPIKFVSLPAAESYYITIRVTGLATVYGWWGSTRKLSIADPIEYSEVFRWQRP